MENNYSVYQHVTPDGLYYFGATSNIKRRWRNNGIEYKGTALYPYIEQYGWDNIQHIVLFREQTRENSLWIENFLIETAQEDGVCINKKRSGLISKEEGYNKNQMKYLREQNHENEVRKQKQYYEQNKDQIKQYYQKNREKLLEQQREYREKNREKYNEYYREYQRQYRKRKKLEKQLKEVETTLF